MLQAAAEVTQRGLAKITLLGDPEEVRLEAEKLGIDISLCNVVKPVVSAQERAMDIAGEGEVNRILTRPFSSNPH